MSDDDLAAPLDALLVDAAFGPWRRHLPDMSTARLAVRLAARPATVARRLRELGAERARVGSGTSEIEPDARDRRFADPAWSSSPLLKRVVQAYLAGGRTVAQLVADAELDWRDDR